MRQRGPRGRHRGRVGGPRENTAQQTRRQSLQEARCLLSPTPTAGRTQSISRHATSLDSFPRGLWKPRTVIGKMNTNRCGVMSMAAHQPEFQHGPLAPSLPGTHRGGANEETAERSRKRLAAPFPPSPLATVTQFLPTTGLILCPQSAIASTANDYEEDSTFTEEAFTLESQARRARTADRHTAHERSCSPKHTSRAAYSAEQGCAAMRPSRSSPAANNDRLFWW